MRAPGRPGNKLRALPMEDRGSFSSCGVRASEESHGGADQGLQNWTSSIRRVNHDAFGKQYGKTEGAQITAPDKFKCRLCGSPV